MPPLHNIHPLLRRLPTLLNNRHTLTINVRSIGDTVNFHEASSRQIRPPPGRLLRRPAARSVELTTPSPDSSVDTQNRSNDAPHRHGKGDKSRINERREAIAKRRLFLEKGASSHVPSSNNIENETLESDSEKIEGSPHDVTEEAASTQSMTSLHHPIKSRTAVHSLNNGRKLSAADMHRLQRNTSRQDSIHDEHQQQQKDEHHHDQQQQQQQDLQYNNKQVGRISREIRHPAGGSIVASQSATTRYRLQRRAQLSHEDESKVGANRKVIPSELSIPLDDGAASTPVISSQEEDFDERLKRLRRAQREKTGMGEDEAGVKEGWSLFDWLWGRKK